MCLVSYVTHVFICAVTPCYCTNSKASLLLHTKDLKYTLATFFVFISKQCCFIILCINLRTLCLRPLRVIAYNKEFSMVESSSCVFGLSCYSFKNSQEDYVHCIVSYSLVLLHLKALINVFCLIVNYKMFFFSFSMVSCTAVKMKSIIQSYII